MEPACCPSGQEADTLCTVRIKVKSFLFRKLTIYIFTISKDMVIIKAKLIPFSPPHGSNNAGWIFD